MSWIYELSILCMSFFYFFFDSLKLHPNYACFYFFNFFYYKIFLKNYLFFSNIFFKKISFFILSINDYFLQYFSLPLTLFQKFFLKKKVVGWLLLYNLIKFKTPLWLKYVYFILKKNKIKVVVSTLTKKYYPWLKYLRQKNFILTGVENPKMIRSIYDFPFYLPTQFTEFYLFFILTLFFKSIQKRLYNFFFFYNFKKMSFFK